MPIKNPTNEFAVAIKDIVVRGTNSIKKDDIGIIESTLENGSATIIFVRAGEKVQLNSDEFSIFDFTQTGDNFTKKICNVCHKLLNTEEFDKNQNGINNRTVRRPSCKECRKDIDGVKMTLTERRKWLENKPEHEIFECPVCHKKTIAGVTSKVVIDHDHDTGLGRAWICDSCNTGLGRFKDDVKVLKEAIKFLETNS